MSLRVFPLPRGLCGLWLALASAAGCDQPSSGAAAPDAGAAMATAAPAPPPPEPARAPEIIVDAASVAIGSDRVSTAEPGLADKVAVFLDGRPAIAGQAVDLVAMRNAKPSQVAVVALAVHRARASAVGVKTEARDGTTQRLPLSFTGTAAACGTTAWIAKDAAIDVWPAGGGTAKRIIKGMAGPDMTLGTEAVAKQSEGCAAPELFVGAEDRLPWGLVFDLATMSIAGSRGRLRSAVLMTSAVPGRKLALDAP